MRMMITLVVALTTLGAAVPAHAQPARARRMLRQRFDIDRDGRLDGAERAALRAYQYARLVRRYDRDGDGRVGPGEVPPRLAERLRRLDRNGDGWIDPAEVLAPPRRAPR